MSPLEEEIEKNESQILQQSLIKDPNNTSKFEEIIVHFPEVDAIEHHPNHSDLRTSFKKEEGTQHNMSRVASTIKDKEEEQNHKKT